MIEGLAEYLLVALSGQSNRGRVCPLLEQQQTTVSFYFAMARPLVVQADIAHLRGGDFAQQEATTLCVMRLCNATDQRQA
jgi:hypothetical protein